MNITIPELALVLLVGVSGSGKSTFARRHFKPTEVLSSDFLRGMVADDENDQSATRDAFDILHFIAARRLAAGRLTVVDATNVQAESRASLLALAREYHVPAVALVFDLLEEISQERNRQRTDRSVPRGVIHSQHRQLRDSIPQLRREGFSHVFVLSSPEEVDAATVTRQPLRCNRKPDRGPFDIIGDVHGCFDELRELLDRLGYQVTTQTDTHGTHRYVVAHPDGRRVIFLGDLVDRGPNTPEVLRLAMDMVEMGVALCVPGNHDNKLLRKLKGRNVRIAHGLEQSLAQLAQQPPEFSERVRAFLDDLVSHYVLDDGRLVVAHAGIPKHMQGRVSARVYDFALYGETSGESDEFGLPIRYQWVQDYRGAAEVVYGHTPVARLRWINRTINIDTGCVFGGRLTALRYPEHELVSVKAARIYSEPRRPPVSDAELLDEEILDIEDVQGKRFISTRLFRGVTIRENEAAAALEVMSRFAVNPRWLIYLPPTMAPTETSAQPDLLEHPAEAFAYYQKQGVETVICEEKHMGSRAVMIVCRDTQAAHQRFGVAGEDGICYTRTGRPFFEDKPLERELLARVRAAFDQSGLWDALDTDWVCLDGEILPWSARAHELLHRQYAAVGAAAGAALPATIAVLEQAARRDLDTDDLLRRARERARMVQDYIATYRRYCWPVRSLNDLQFAPFHLLASEKAVHIDKDHTWHLQVLARLCQADPDLLPATSYRLVQINDPDSQAAGVRWWEELTQRGGEGMVVKPQAFVTYGQYGLVQPAIKCRGREYLRIIYGPEYTAPANLERLRTRNVDLKRSLALREFALGIEALERFALREPLYRVHECVFGVLALESEPVDPRL